MSTLQNCLNLTGLIFDIIGFIGLFSVREKFFDSASYNDIKLLAKHLGREGEKSGRDLMTELLHTPVDVDTKDPKRKFYFIVLIGFAFQLAALISSFLI